MYKKSVILKSAMDKKGVILKRAKELAKKSKTWADFSNALFDPFDGELVRSLPTKEDREAFRKTKEYREIRLLLQQKMRETGLANGATPTKSGKFVVRLPRSLHGALEREAEVEGTSLNQLVVTKLAIQLENLAGGRLGGLIQAFGEVRDGFSVDRVIADPELDRKFLKRCRELGLSGTDLQLNWELIGARKASKLSHLPKTRKYTVRKTDEFEYASELAIRHLELTKNISLDRIICDPDLAAEFDEYASCLARGFSSLEYRWVALGLRKAGRRGSAKKKIEELPDLETLGRVKSVSLGKVPDACGIYLFSSDKHRVFMGQTENLRHRFERHMEGSQSCGLPDWLWDVKSEPLRIGVAQLPGFGRGVRQRIELSFIKKWKPLLNYPRKTG